MTDIEEQIQEFLSENIRPVLARDGGDVSFEGYQDGIVRLKLRGACAGCPGAAMTLKMVIESQLKEKFPQIKGVMPV